MCFSILGGSEGEREVEPAILLAACLCQGNVKEYLSNFLLSLFVYGRGGLVHLFNLENWYGYTVFFNFCQIFGSNELKG